MIKRKFLREREQKRLSVGENIWNERMRKDDGVKNLIRETKEWQKSGLIVKNFWRMRWIMEWAEKMERNTLWKKSDQEM